MSAHEANVPAWATMFVKHSSREGWWMNTNAIDISEL